MLLIFVRANCWVTGGWQCSRVLFRAAFSAAVAQGWQGLCIAPAVRSALTEYLWGPPVQLLLRPCFALLVWRLGWVQFLLL